MSDSKGATSKKIGKGDVYDQYMKMQKDKKKVEGGAEDDNDDDEEISADSDDDDLGDDLDDDEDDDDDDDDDSGEESNKKDNKDESGSYKEDDFEMSATPKKNAKAAVRKTKLESPTPPKPVI